MKNLKFKYTLLMVFFLFLLTACEKELELEEPNTIITRDVVFSNDETAKSALQGIYNQLYLSHFSSGYIGSVSVLCELSSDNLKPMNTNRLELVEFQQYELLADNPRIMGLWQSAYNIIYMTNALLEGLEKSTQISIEVAKRLEGETKFIRAFTYFYLVNLYGDVPLVLTTNYDINAVVNRTSTAEVYQQIIKDLNVSAELLGENYREGERTYVTRYVAMALLARVHLYLENWDLAETYSSEVIAQSSKYNLIDDLDLVFLANSQEAIWQLSPIGRGIGMTNTNEGLSFIIKSSFAYVKLSEDLWNDMKEEDKRRKHWINYYEQAEVHYAFKYKIYFSSDPVTEYSMALRLAEQYLIRAEARAQQNKLSDAIADLDKIRERAGLDLLSVTNPGISKETLLNEILKERRHELFTEWGHRWFDLKRTGKAQEILAPISSGWEDTDKLYPIPSNERMKNSNLSQNPGY